MPKEPGKARLSVSGTSSQEPELKVAASIAWATSRLIAATRCSSKLSRKSLGMSVYAPRLVVISEMTRPQHSPKETASPVHYDISLRSISRRVIKLRETQDVRTSADNDSQPINFIATGG